MTDEPERDCSTCRHFFVTWRPEFPRACRAFGFQTRDWPSHVVRRESGAACSLHEPRARAWAESRGRDADRGTWA